MTDAPPVPSNLVTAEALLHHADGPGFAEPWMAQAFACAIQLSRRGLFTWSEWVEVFSAEIKSHPAQPGEASNAAYYRQWLAALETIVGLKGAASTARSPSARKAGAKPISTRHTVSQSSCATPRRLQRQLRIMIIITNTAPRSRSPSAPRNDRCSCHFPSLSSARDKLVGLIFKFRYRLRVRSHLAATTQQPTGITLMIPLC